MAGGVVVVNPDLEGYSADHAKALIELLGLDKSPRTSSHGDTRWLKLKDEWSLAERYKTKYQNGNLNLDCLIEYIKCKGNWSIWFTVFDGFDEVRSRMINDFPGTARQCFDADNHYTPLMRNPEKTILYNQ